jgi:RNA polymerase sigma factor (sigma-70 family)
MNDDADASEDHALMSAFARGDARAFDRLYERHQAALYRFVRRLLGHACAAQTDEVFQDTWLRVIQSRERWAPQGASFRTWLFTLAHHRAIDCLRKSGREVSVDAGADAQPWEPDAPGAAWAHWPDAGAIGADDRLFWRRAGERLLGCLEGLPASQRAVFLLHHEDGLTLDELARGLELGFETAKSRLRYAMAKLRACMGAYLPLDPNTSAVTAGADGWVARGAADAGNGGLVS